MYDEDELASINERVCAAGDVQFENPYHIHRAPEPKRGDYCFHVRVATHHAMLSERRTLFVAWDHHRFANASLTVVTGSNWKVSAPHVAWFVAMEVPLHVHHHDRKCGPTTASLRRGSASTQSRVQVEALSCFSQRS